MLAVVTASGKGGCDADEWEKGKRNPSRQCQRDTVLCVGREVHGEPISEADLDLTPSVTGREAPEAEPGC